MKKIYFIITITIICVVIDLFLINRNNKDVKENNENQKSVSINLFDFKEFKNISLEKIKNINLKKYGEYGLIEENYSDIGNIESIYNKLKIIKIGNESNKGCDDNTTIYTFDIDNQNIEIEIECDVLVYDNKRYEIIK